MCVDVPVHLAAVCSLDYKAVLDGIDKERSAVACLIDDVRECQDFHGFACKFVVVVKIQRTGIDRGVVARNEVKLGHAVLVEIVEAAGFHVHIVILDILNGRSDIIPLKQIDVRSDRLAEVIVEVRFYRIRKDGIVHNRYVRISVGIFEKLIEAADL